VAARQSAQDQLIADFTAEDAVLVQDPAIQTAVLRLARASVCTHLAEPASAQFSGEVVKCPPNGHYLAIGRVDAANPSGQPTANWYVFACTPTMQPTFTELLESDPGTGT
jgi:hypothetical protein